MPFFYKPLIAFTLLLFSIQIFAERLAPPLQDLANTYPIQFDQPAEVLEKRIVTEVDEKGFEKNTVYIAVRINQQEAIDDYSQINLYFNDFFEELTLNFANVLTKDGKLASLRDDAIQIKSESNESFYEDGKSLAFSLPLTYTGSIIEFQFTKSEIRKRIDGHFYKSVSMYHWERKANARDYRADFVHFSNFTLHLPNNNPVNYYTPPEFSIDHKKEENTYSWQSLNLQPVILQSFIPTELNIAPYVEVSSISNWKTVTDWASQLIEPTINSNTAIEQIAQSIKSKTTNKEEQIKQVFHYLQDNIRYVFAHVGRGGYEPHQASEVLNNGYGDCKDQTVLTISLLRAIGIKAYPALISTSSSRTPNEEVPGVKFDHMITYIPKQKGVQEAWLDTVGGNLLYPGITYGVDEQKTLIIDGQSNHLVKLNDVLTKQDAANISIEVTPPVKSIMSANFTMTFKGKMESSVRNWLRYSTDTNTSIKELFANLYSRAEIKDIEIINLDNTNEEVLIKGVMQFKGNNTEEEYQPFSFSFSTAKYAELFSLIPNIDAPIDRQYPIEINQNAVVSSRVKLQKPDGYVLTDRKEPQTYISNDVFELSHTLDDQEGHIVIEQALTLKPIHADLNEYKEIHRHFKSVYDQYWYSLLAYDEEKNSLKKLLSTPSTEKSEKAYIELISTLLDNGEYENALTQAQEAIKLFSQNGNIYYLQGLAYSFLGQDESANTSFEKAKDMGYEI